jgi:histidine triad (HIT) family protein
MDTVFHKIIRGEIPSDIVYDDAECIVIKDIAPKAPVHLLVIPKKNIINLSEMITDDRLLVGKLLQVAADMAEKFNIKDAFKIVINNGKGAGQEVFQLHVHVLGGWDGKPTHLDL